MRALVGIEAQEMKVAGEKVKGQQTASYDRITISCSALHYILQ